MRERQMRGANRKFYRPVAPGLSITKKQAPKHYPVFTKPDKWFEVPPDADSTDYKSPNN